MEEKSAQANKRVKEIMDKADFINHGHRSVLALIAEVKESSSLSIGNLIEGISEVNATTTPIVSRMQHALKTLQACLTARKAEDQHTWAIQGEASCDERLQAMESTANNIMDDLMLL